MDTDRAYLLGLIIGGGIFGNAEDVFRIRLPYKKWGSYLENPGRAGQIAGDILRKVGQMFRAVYNLTVQYETTEGGTWTILCEGDTTAVKDDLARYGITCEGEVRGNVDISRIVPELVDDNLKRRFVAGLADTIGSMAKSATSEIRRRRWGTPQNCASCTLQAMLHPSPMITPAFLHFPCGGSGITAFSSAMCAVSSRTARKSLPPFEEKAPHTFSHTMNLGRTSSPVLPCILSFSLISFTILI